MTKAVLFGIRVPFPQNLDASSLPSFQCCQSPSQQGSGVRLIPLSCVLLLPAWLLQADFLGWNGTTH